jgi:hypothetical protein
MMKRVFLFLTILAATQIFISIAYSQTEKGGSPRTITLSSGEVVCDLNGQWTALYEYYGPYTRRGSYKDTLKVTQKDNKFVGKNLISGEAVGKDIGNIRGELDRNGIKKAQVMTDDGFWATCRGEMFLSKDCNKMVLDDGRVIKVTLERK